MNTPDSRPADQDHADRRSDPDLQAAGSADSTQRLAPLDPALYDGLNALLEGAHADMRAEVLSLNALGVQIRQWRLRRGWTRHELAAQIAVKPTQLTSVENGMAQVDDFPKQQLLALSALAAKDSRDPLAVAIEQHLSSFCS